MHVSDRWSLVYVAPPKTASQSIRDWLYTSNGEFRVIATHHWLPDDHNGVDRREITDRRNHLWILSVRNPFSRIVAWVNFRRRCCRAALEGHEGLQRLFPHWTEVRREKCIKDEGEYAKLWTTLSFDAILQHPAPLSHRLPPRHDFKYFYARMPHVDHLIRTECIEEDLRRIPHVGIQELLTHEPIPHHDKTPRAEGEHWWQEYVQPVSIDFIRQRYREDFRLLSHVYTDSFEDAKEGRFTNET